MTNKGMSFSFNYTTQEKTYYTLLNLDKKKACEENFIPEKTQLENNKITKGYVFLLYASLTSTTHCLFQFFSKKLKRLTLYRFMKRRANLISKIIIPLVSFPFSPKFIKGVCLLKYIVTLIKFSLNSVNSEYRNQHSLLHMVKKLKKRFGQ